MEIKQQDEYKLLKEYIFTFNSGFELTFMLDEEAGDTITKQNDKLVIRLVAKPNLLEPNTMADAEEHEVYKEHLAATSMRLRKLRKPTAEEALELKQTVHKLAKTVQ